MQSQSAVLEMDLQHIAETLIINGTLTECPGLVHGKTGIAIFFFHYAQYTENELFADYAMDLIYEMLNQLHVNSSSDYENGLAGIGVGIDYLIQNNFLNVEDDVCGEFDERMYHAVMHKPSQNFSKYTGLTGYGKYWITRLRYQEPSVQAREYLLRIIVAIEENLPKISIKERTDVYCFLCDLLGILGFESCSWILEQCRKIWAFSSSDCFQHFPRFDNFVVGSIIRVYQLSKYFNATLQDDIDINIDIALKQIIALDMGKAPASTGLLSGYAGEGMIRLTALNKTDKEWMNLL